MLSEGGSGDHADRTESNGSSQESRLSFQYRAEAAKHRQCVQKPGTSLKVLQFERSAREMQDGG